MKLLLQIIVFIQIVLICFLYIQNKSISEDNLKLLNKLNETQLKSDIVKIVKVKDEKNYEVAVSGQVVQCINQKKNNVTSEAFIDDVENYIYSIEEKIDDVAVLLRSELNNGQTEHEIFSSLNTLTQLERPDLNALEVTHLLDITSQHSKALQLQVLEFLEGSLEPEHSMDLFPYIQSEDLTISKKAFTRLKELDNTESVIGMLDELSFNALHLEIQQKASDYLENLNQTTNTHLDQR